MLNFGKKYLFSSIGLILVLFLGIYFFPEEDAPLVEVEQKWKGVCWVGTRDSLSGGELKLLHQTGANALSQTPFAFQSDVNNPEIRWNAYNDGKWWGETARGIGTTLDHSKELGITNILKPHIWVRGSWPGEIEMLNEGDWKLWFENYLGFILDYARLAEELQIPVLCIGTELEKTTHRTEDWRIVISQIRKVYSGELIYAANFTEFEKIEFWDDLDYIGIQAYFPLSKNHKPALAELKKGWVDPIKKIEKSVRQFQKPVVFTEIGYCNTVDAAIEPWVWPNERKKVELSEEVQALCYQAFFETVWEKPWMSGVFFWKWFPKAHHQNPDFTPQGKKAQEVMTTFFLQD